jgi:dehydrogenase/reductase SDR family protein 12
MLSVVDTVLDRTLVLGYTRPGYELRRRGWSDHGQPSRLDGYTVAVTGATSGLGRATAAGVHQLGARVLLVVRSRERGEDLVRDLTAASAAAGFGGGGDRLRVSVCDLADLDSVRRCAAGLLDSSESIDVLINNAGVMANRRTLSPDGIELTFATNVVGPFLLTNLLKPAFAASSGQVPGRGRVINVSSGGMYGQRIHVDDLEMSHSSYSGLTAYARSKRAAVILTGLWAERWRAAEIGVHATHPGWADTEGVRDSMPRFRMVTKPLLRSPEQGADTAVWLAGAEPAILGTGGFWHDRRRRPTHLLPTTHESAEDRSELWRQLCELSGWQDRTVASPAPYTPAGVS